MELRDKTSQANNAVIRIRSVKEKMKAAGAKNPAIMAQLSALEENLYQVKNQSSQDPLNYPIKLNNRLASLWRSVETGDAKPTAGAYKVSQELTAELDKYMAELDRLMKVKSIKKFVVNTKK